MRRKTTHTYLVIPLALTFATFPLMAAGRIHPTPQTEQRTEKAPVWTNKDIDKLRDQNSISLVGPEPTATPNVAPSANDSMDFCRYIEETARVQADINAREMELRQYVDALAEAKSLQMTVGGVDLNEGDAGITPDSGIANLQSQIQTANGRLDALADFARRHNFPVNVLYGLTGNGGTSESACLAMQP